MIASKFPWQAPVMDIQSRGNTDRSAPYRLVFDAPGLSGDMGTSFLQCKCDNRIPVAGI
jgi:hypothetical protein